MPITITLPPVRLFSSRLTVVTEAMLQAGAAALRTEHELIMTQAKRNVPVDLGTLRASGVVLPTVREGNFLVSRGGFGGAARAYAVVVHEGRRPGARMPPVEAIRGWLRRVGGDEQMAFPVARSIGRRGTRPLKYYETPLLEAARGMGGRLAASIARRVGTG
jgi:hypothetical protein